MTRYHVTRLFRRTVAAIPRFKRLIPVRDPGDTPIAFGTQLGQLCSDVVFRVLQDPEGHTYWAKQWLNARAPLEVVTLRIERFLATRGDPSLVLATDHTPAFGLVYPFDEALFSSTTIVHQWDISWYFPESDCRSIRSLASLVVRWPDLPEVELGHLTDFQATHACGRLKILDFEPSHRYAASLARVQLP